METTIDLVKNTSMITGFVMVMMLLIEYLNVKTKGHFNKELSKKPHVQILFATILGLIPGCLGTYTVVSLFTHKILSLGALTAALIATSGDEAFFMLSLIPEQSIYIMLILFAVAVGSGYAVHFALPNNRYIAKFAGHFELHRHELEQVSAESTKPYNLKNIQFHRALLIAGIVAFIISVTMGLLSHSHDTHADHVHEHAHHAMQLGWVEYTFIVVSLFALFVVLTVSDHFLEDHLWKHILKKHFLRILLWTFAALGIATIFEHFVHIPEIKQGMLWAMLGIALLVGLIPESGPHLVFVSLYISGNIPLSILIANSIVQDGHGAIPLFAESKKSFFLVKAINLIVGGIIGSLLLYFGI